MRIWPWEPVVLDSPGGSVASGLTSHHAGLTRGSHFIFVLFLDAEGCCGTKGDGSLADGLRCLPFLLLSLPPQPSSAVQAATTSAPPPVPPLVPAVWREALAAPGASRPGPERHQGQTPRTLKGRASQSVPQPGKTLDEPHGLLLQHLGEEMPLPMPCLKTPATLQPSTPRPRTLGHHTMACLTVKF